MIRVRLDIAYEGTNFSGWARQPGLRTVQGTLEDALAGIFGDDAAHLTVAGRTDAGVHARGQVAHLDVPEECWQALPGRSSYAPDIALVRRLAGILPSDVLVRLAQPAPSGFDARFSALYRFYTYRIADAVFWRDPLTSSFVLWHPRLLDEVAMSRATGPLRGEHDFLPFCRPRPGASTVRLLQRLDIRRGQNGVIEIDVQADAFCHHMVRMLVGALIAVGEGRRDEKWPGQVLAAGLRDSAVPVVPARGLVLERVAYPADDQVAAQAAAARTVRGPLF